MTVLSGANHVGVAGWRCSSDLVSEETIFSNSYFHSEKYKPHVLLLKNVTQTSSCFLCLTVFMMRSTKGMCWLDEMGWQRTYCGECLGILEAMTITITVVVALYQQCLSVMSNGFILTVNQCIQTATSSVFAFPLAIWQELNESVLISCVAVCQYWGDYWTLLTKIPKTFISI